MNISILGGDQRIIELAKLIKSNERNNVYVYGIDEISIIKDFEIANCLEEAIEKSDVVITPIPLSKDGIYINAPFCKDKIQIKDIFNNIKNKKIITGNITEDLEDYASANQNNIIDVLRNDSLAVLNAIPTAEGAIQIAIEKSNITIHNSNCLVMGFGKIGKVLAKILKGFGANVYCEARKPSDIALISALGYNGIDLKDLNNNLDKFDFIFNTIPHIVLNESNLDNIKKECIIIDLASKPGGVNFEYAKTHGLKAIWALALPRKSGSKDSCKVYL